MFSIPPATTTSLCPRAMPWAAKVIDFIPDEQTLFTPVQIVDTGRPANIEAWRDGDWPTPADITWPIIASVI